MSRSLNKIMLIGNVGSDPEVRSTASGARVAKTSLATNRSFQDKSGQQQDRTDWHRLTFFGKLADIVEQWVHKGDKIYVEGASSTRRRRTTRAARAIGPTSSSTR
jgi:single-strand DNA-binding protein